MSRFHTKLIDERYNDQMLDIMQASPINANGLSLYFDKSPDIFEIPRMKYTHSDHMGFFKDQTLLGFGSIGYFDALVKGVEENVFIFYNFYLLPEGRGTEITQAGAKEFFSGARGKANYGISVTLKGNRAIESYIGRKIGDWMPPTRVIDELVVKSILFALPKKNKTRYTVRNAGIDDIPEMVKLLQVENRQRDFGILHSEDTFIPNLNRRKLNIENYYVASDASGAIQGVCLAWDCNAFRRTRILKFSRGFYPSVFTYKCLEKILPLTPFPSAGESFNELTITDYAVSGRNPEIMHALLSEIYYRNHNRHYHFMNWASCGSDPLLQAAKGFWYTNLTSHIIFTSMDPGRYNLQPTLPYIDIAFL